MLPPSATLTPSQQVDVGGWLLLELAPFQSMTVSSLVPPRFSAYARILHPAGLRVGNSMRRVPWGEVAALNDGPAHAAVSWEALVGANRDSGPGWDHEPSRGSLPSVDAAALATVLREHTSTPTTCWFAVWDGFGSLPSDRESGVLELPCRPMRLLTGPVEAASQSCSTTSGHQSPSLWWPEDRAWCVATDVDLMSTYVGGTRQCIRDVLTNSTLEAWPVAAEHIVSGTSAHEHL